jgi:hypothetical protein
MGMMCSQCQWCQWVGNFRNFGSQSQPRASPVGHVGAFSCEFHAQPAWDPGHEIDSPLSLTIALFETPHRHEQAGDTITSHA